jgi:hypothetical protein
MGIYNDVLLCWGIVVNFKDIVALKNRDDFKERKEMIGCGYMPNLWAEMGHIVCSEYSNVSEEEHCYIIGKEIPTNVSLDEFLKSFDADEMRAYLREVCRDYNLEYSEPKIICKCNVY